MRATAIVVTLALAPAPAAQTLVQTVEGTADGDAAGVAVAAIGDVNKDGRGDFAVGAPGDDGNGKDSGSVFVYSGADLSVLYLFRGEHARDEFGYAVAAAGDVDADGYADLVVGAPYEDHQAEEHLHEKAGSAQVISGRDGKILYTFRGPSSGDALGWSVGTLGDVDKDGHAEVVVGAPFYDRTNAPDIGMVAVYSGETGKLLYQLEGKQAGDRFGWALGSLGDVKGRRTRELVVGIEGSSDKKRRRNSDPRLVQAGSAQIFSGRGGRPRRAPLRTGQDQDYFGTAVASVGDVDGDGREDLLVGAWNGQDQEGERTGIAVLFSGSSGKVLRQVAGTTAYDHFGAAVAGLGDVDGDGTPDFAVGAPQEPQKGSGYVRVFSGATGGILFTLIGEAIGDLFGTSVCAMGDRNEDGIPDLMVGAPGLRKRGGFQVFTSPER